MEKSSIEDILALGNDGAPEEWLSFLTGEGIGDGFEGLSGDALQAEIDALPPLETLIQADYEMSHLLCNSGNFTRGRGGRSVDYIIIHYTAGSQTSEGAARANCVYFGRDVVGASAHYFIDDGYVIWNSVPEGDTAWHAGNWAMNQRSIGIEVCTDGAFTAAEISRLAWLVQHLMNKYGISADHVIRHYDVTGKHCPAYYVDASRWSVLHKQITDAGIIDVEPSEAASISGDALDLAYRAINGEFGNGDARKNALGDRYDEVQELVNKIVKGELVDTTKEEASTGFEGGAYRCTVNGLRVRTKPSLSGDVVAQYNEGETVNLDSWYTIADGWVWGRYTSWTGHVRYIAVGKPTGGYDPSDYLVKI